MTFLPLIIRKDAGQTGFDTPFYQPASDEPAAPPDPTQADEEQQNNNPRSMTPPSPMLWTFQSPNDDATDAATPDGQTHDPLHPELLNSDEAQELAEQTPPPAFHEPLPTPGAGLVKTASTGKPQRAPRGQESGETGEWSSKRAFNFVPAGELGTSGRHTQPADQDLPRDAMGNVKQDGPVWGPSNPGANPASQVSVHQGSPEHVTAKDRVHFFDQCPQCGVATTGTEAACPNPWCGHDLEGDNTASYDSWQYDPPSSDQEPDT